MEQATPKMTRRQEYAEATRQAIVDTARRLFAERGYFATKVDDIAAEARVAPATVYAVTGGKLGLLNELITTWTTDPIVEATIGHILVSPGPGRDHPGARRRQPADARAVRRHHPGHAFYGPARCLRGCTKGQGHLGIPVVTGAHRRAARPAQVPAPWDRPRPRRRRFVVLLRVRVVLHPA